MPLSLDAAMFHVEEITPENSLSYNFEKSNFDQFCYFCWVLIGLKSPEGSPKVSF
jgi:hypothetical protein